MLWTAFSLVSKFLTLNETKGLPISKGLIQALAHSKYFKFLICGFKIQEYCIKSRFCHFDLLIYKPLRLIKNDRNFTYFFIFDAFSACNMLQNMNAKQFKMY